MSSITSTCNQKGSAANHIHNHSVFPKRFDSKQSIKASSEENIKTISKYCSIQILKNHEIFSLPLLHIFLNPHEVKNSILLPFSFAH